MSADRSILRNGQDGVRTAPSAGPEPTKICGWLNEDWFAHVQNAAGTGPATDQPGTRGLTRLVPTFAFPG